MLDFGLLLLNKEIDGLLINYWINTEFNGKRQKSMNGIYEQLKFNNFGKIN